MNEFLQSLLQLPTLFFTATLAVSFLYWLLVVVGAADLNPFDGAEGVAEGATGAVKGAVEGATGAVKGATEAAGADVIDAAASKVSALGEAMAFLGLTRVPVTISFSFFSLFAWFLSFATRHYLDPLLPSVASALVATGTSVVGGLALTSLLTRPLGRIFEEGHAPTSRSLVGKSVRITTVTVDENTGQGELKDGGLSMVLSVRAAPGNGLKYGDEAVIVDVDLERDLFTVEPMKALLPQDLNAFAAAAAASAPAEAKAEPVAVGKADADRNGS